MDATGGPSHSISPLRVGFCAKPCCRAASQRFDFSSLPLTASEQSTLDELLRKVLTSLGSTNLERCTLCRMCDDRVCTDCPIPADKPTHSLA